MARGRRGKRRTSGRDKRSRGNRPRRVLPLAVSLAAVPVGLVLAAALVVTTGDDTDPSAAEGEIGESMTSAAPDSDSDDDFFADPTRSPDDSLPSEADGAQDARVTASSVPEDEDSDEEGSGGGGEGGSDDGGSGGGDSSGGGGGGGGGGGQSAGPLAEEVVSLVNNERSHHGCDPVEVDTRLTAAAQEHSEDMNSRNYMSHHSPEGEGPGERAERHGYHAWGAENVAKGQTSPEQVMNAWMNSPGHRRNILNCGLESIGVGEAGYAWTQKFGWE